MLTFGKKKFTCCKFLFENQIFKNYLILIHKQQFPISYLNVKHVVSQQSFIVVCNFHIFQGKAFIQIFTFLYLKICGKIEKVFYFFSINSWEKKLFLTKTNKTLNQFYLRPIRIIPKNFSLYCFFFSLLYIVSTTMLI
jgi:hypothetical protein